MQKDCPEIGQLIPQYLAGELLDGEDSTFREHLEACEKCAGLLERYRALLGEGRNLDSPVRFEAAWREVVGKSEGRKAPRTKPLDLAWNYKIPALLASICIASALLFSLLEPARVQPAMSATEMEEILRSMGEINGKAGESAPSQIGEPYPLLGGSGDERSLRLAGVSSDDKTTYKVELF
ncbi:MAG: zf-HC2 domain-containing protein [Candidatus Hydrogenedentota bacterium]|nr:MAG: zf-HC2 domain-containing protein [Candidatus Hydrogenedentota bacterium]